MTILKMDLGTLVLDGAAAKDTYTALSSLAVTLAANVATVTGESNTTRPAPVSTPWCGDKRERRTQAHTGGREKRTWQSRKEKHGSNSRYGVSELGTISRSHELSLKGS